MSKPGSWDEIRPGAVVTWTDGVWSMSKRQAVPIERRMRVASVTTTHGQHGTDTRTLTGVILTRNDRPDLRVNNYPISDPGVAPAVMGCRRAVSLSWITDVANPDADAPVAPAAVELDEAEARAAAAGAVFVRTRGLDVAAGDTRFRTRKARVGSEVVDLYTVDGEYVARLGNTPDGWMVETACPAAHVVSGWFTFADAVREAYAHRTRGCQPADPGRDDADVAAQVAAAADSLRNANRAGDPAAATAARAGLVDALHDAADRIIRAASDTAIRDGVIRPETGHPTVIEGPDLAGHWEFRCTVCPDVGATGFEEVEETLVAALRHGPLAADSPTPARLDDDERNDDNALLEMADEAGFADRWRSVVAVVAGELVEYVAQQQPEHAATLLDLVREYGDARERCGRDLSATTINDADRLFAEVGRRLGEVTDTLVAAVTAVADQRDEIIADFEAGDGRPVPGAGAAVRQATAGRAAALARSVAIGQTADGSPVDCELS